MLKFSMKMKVLFWPGGGSWYGEGVKPLDGESSNDLNNLRTGLLGPGRGIAPLLRLKRILVEYQGREYIWRTWLH